MCIVRSLSHRSDAWGGTRILGHFGCMAFTGALGWLAGALCFYNFTYYRRYHTWHHRYTQDPQRDPELSTPKPRSLIEYAVHISGIPFWIQKPRELMRFAAGRTTHLAYVPENARS